MAEHGVLDRLCIEDVCRHRCGPEGTQEGRLLVVASHARDLVAGGDQLPYSPLAQHTGRPGDEDLHN